MASAGLEQLRDIREPPAPYLTFWESSGEWLIWLTVALAALVALGWLIYCRQKHSSPSSLRRQALRKLQLLNERHARDGNAASFASGLDTLLRQEAKRRYPEQGIQRLTGEDWLNFLDRTGGDGLFAKGPGRCLATLPYQRQGKLDSAELVGLVTAWLER